MTVGSMDALMGASMAQKLTSVPMSAYTAAERKGDTATMARAMGYAQDSTNQALSYSAKAQEELIKERQEERKEQKIQLKEAIENRRAENKTDKANKADETVSGAKSADSVEISDNAKEFISHKAAAGDTSSVVKCDMAAIYTPEGNTVPLEQPVKVVDIKA